MKYIKIIESVLSRFGYSNCQVKKIKRTRAIHVIFSPYQIYVTQTLLSSLMSIDGLFMNSIHFDERRILFVY